MERDITPEIKASTKPEDIQACLHAGVLPDCYEGTNIRIEVQALSNISCFIRHEDGRVTCPMGRELFKQRDTKYGTEYSSREACRTCPNRCTDSKREKHVNIGRNSTYVPVIMYGDSRYPLRYHPQRSENAGKHGPRRDPGLLEGALKERTQRYVQVSHSSSPNRLPIRIPAACANPLSAPISRDSTGEISATAATSWVPI